MKQLTRKISILLILTMVIQVFAPLGVPADEANTLTLNVNGQALNKLYLVQGDTASISVLFGETTVRPKKATYSSSQKAVASVTKRGVIRAKSQGKTVITVRYKKQKKKLKVFVIDPDAGSTQTTAQKASAAVSSAASADDGNVTMGAFTSGNGAGKLSCSTGSSIKTGTKVVLKLNSKAKNHNWTWSYSGTAGKDVHELNMNYKKNGQITFSVWPSGGTLQITGTDPSGARISYGFAVSQNAKWARREAFRTDALAGVNPGMSQKELINYFVQYIADRAEYGKGQGNVFRVIDEGVGDCWCYSTAFQLLAEAVGIESIIVKNSLKTSHYWNQVNIDGVWYNVDAQGFDTNHSFKKWVLVSDERHGSRFLAGNYSSKGTNRYPISPGHECSSNL